MNNRTKLIRGWLLQQPRPVKVRVRSGEDIEVIEKGLTKWASIAASIDALDPDVLEALDSDGKLQRAIKIEQLETTSEDDEASTPETKREEKRLAGEQAMLTTFATLLAKAYEHSTSVAFGKMVELADAHAKRGEAMERSLQATERLLRKAYDEGASSGSDGEPSLLETMVSAFAGGKQQAGVEQAVAHTVGRKTNGKAQI